MARTLHFEKAFYETDFLALGKTEERYHIRIRYLCFSHLKEGQTIESVARMLRIQPRTISYWISRYKTDGLDGLKDKSGRGAKTKLDKKHENKFRDKVIAMQAERKGGRTRGEDIQTMLEQDFNASCSLSSVYALLKRVGLSWISSRSRHPEQDPETQELFKKLRSHRYRCPQCKSLLR